MTLAEPSGIDTHADIHSDEARVLAAVEQLIADHPPSSSSEREFLEAQYDAGLAWVHFPEGDGGLGVSPKLQKLVIDTISAAGGPIGGAKNPIGYGMCAPAIVTHGTEEHKRLLRPLFSRLGALQLPTYALFVSIFGGVTLFGGWGLLLGPLLLRLSRRYAEQPETQHEA